MLIDENFKPLLKTPHLYWDEDSEEANKPNFYHKPSGYKLTWYKYPMRGALANKDITPNQFVQILSHCINSYNKNKLKDGEVLVIYSCQEWWNNEK